MDLTISRVNHPGEKPRVSHADRLRRAQRRATRLPAVLPLPELHDVPDNGLVRTPPMGWNSWNHFAGRVRMPPFAPPPMRLLPAV